MNLTIPKRGHPWLAIGGSWVETGDGPLLSAVYLYNVVRSSLEARRAPLAGILYPKVPVDSGQSN